MKLKGYIFRFMAVMAAAMICWACSNDNPEPPAGNEPPGADEPSADAGKTRTVMVYMIADNSLGRSECDLMDIEEMQAAVDNGALGDSGRLIVYHNAPGTASGVAPKMFEITPGQRTTLRTYPDDPSIYSTDPERFTEVLDDMVRFAPADQYGLVLWSHGTGWIESAGSRSGGAPGPEHPIVVTSFGDDRQHKMKITTLASVLRGRNLDFIYFDCCHMASVEVMYELKDAAPVIVGSGTELPAAGMDYSLNVPFFFAPGKADMVGAARATFELYDAMPGSSRSCTMTVVDTGKLDELAKVSREVMELGLAGGKEDGQYQSYMRKAEGCYGSLYDMADYYETLQGADLALIARWRAALDAAVTYSASTPTIFNVLTMNSYCGLGTYIITDPGQTDYMGYHNQAWWKDVVSHNPNFQ